MLVVFTRTEHGPGLDSAPYTAAFERRRRDPDDGVCLAGTWGAELAADVEPPAADEPVIVKHGYDAMSVAELPALLAAAGRDTVVVSGVATTLCVAATVAGAFERGLFPIVVREATAASNAAARRATLRWIDRYYGDVVPVALITDAWR